MTLIKSTSVALALVALGQLFIACTTNAGPPPNSVPSNRACSNDLQCRLFKVPSCMHNERQCFDGFCMISPIEPCLETATTATVAPAPVPPPGTPAAVAPAATPASPN